MANAARHDPNQHLAGARIVDFDVAKYGRLARLFQQNGLSLSGHFRMIAYSPGVRELLIEGFRYDAWANQAWLPVLPTFQDRDRAEAIFRHILQAQRIWLVRTLSEEEAPPLSDDLGEAISRLSEAWIALVATCDPGAFVSYTTMAGESHFNTVEQIARHVVNHGTYHRGQLRGLKQAEGSDGFPETDLIRFLRQVEV